MEGLAEERGGAASQSGSGGDSLVQSQKFWKNKHLKAKLRIIFEIKITGNGSRPSRITKPSTRCVRTCVASILSGLPGTLAGDEGG